MVATLNVEHDLSTRAPARADRAALVLASGVALNFLGLSTGYFERTWGATPIPIPMMSYALNAAILIWLPLRQLNPRLDRTEAVAWTLAAWSSIGVVMTPLLAPARHSLVPLTAAIIAGSAALMARRQKRDA